MITTVVGSYPIQPTNVQLERAMWRGVGIAEDGPEDPYLDCIRETVSEMAGAGIGLVADGQIRNNMINLFTDGLAGIRRHARPVVVGDIRHVAPITLADVKYARSVLPKGAGLKGIITGPTTLARSVADKHYGDQGELILAFARAMAAEARCIAPHVPVIQVDEPFLSSGFDDVSREAVRIIRDAAPDVKLAMHVCGDVGELFPRLAEFPVDILDHEFCAQTGLVDVVREHPCRQSLGLGCVRSDDDRVESVDEIRALLRRGADLVGADRIYADPDCGLRHRTRASALGKLKNIAAAARTFDGEA